MKYIYPAVFIKDKDGTYAAEVPDLPGCYSCGDTLLDAMEMIKDATEMWLSFMEDKKEEIPHASDMSDFFGDGKIVTLFIADTASYRNRVDNRPVKKMLSIPAWMASEAKAAGLELSKVLQEAIQEKLKTE